MEEKTKGLHGVNDINFVDEFHRIVKMFDVEFAKITQNGAIYRYYNDVVNKYKLKENDLSRTDITDYLVESEEGKTQIGDKMYYFPPYMFDIINDLVNRILSIRCEELYKNLHKANLDIDSTDFKTDFRVLYLSKLRKAMEIVRRKSKIYNDETGRMVVAPDENKEEFRLRQIRGAILIASLEDYKLSMITNLKEN